MKLFAAATAEAGKVEPADALFLPPLADEWYTVTIADVSVGYMNTQLLKAPENATISTMEVMDVQVRTCCPACIATPLTQPVYFCAL